MAPGTDKKPLCTKNRVQRPLHLVERSQNLRTRQAKQKYTHLKSEKKKKRIYTCKQYEDLLFDGDEDVGGSGTPREGEPALGAMRFVQYEVSSLA